MLHISCGRWSTDAEALLFDLDGTLVDTSQAVIGSWRAAAAELGLPFAAFSPYVHGIPATEVLAKVAPTLSAAGRRDVAQAVLARQASPDAPVTLVPGAAALLSRLPAHGWAVVTSGDARLAAASLSKTGLPSPPVIVTADDVTAGKPDPQPYLRAAELLGVDVRRCAAVEDSPAGLRSALAAGLAVIAVTTTHTRQQLTGAACHVPDLTGVSCAESRESRPRQRGDRSGLL
ncbi:MAG TPA: HAD-IA family hydrolase [Dactylosporangium sp.]|nr:HAD-IA family hydrolase [Dactylosporangium sp.]